MSEGSAPQEPGWPIPTAGLLTTHLLIAEDVAASALFYERVFGAQLLMTGPPAILRFANTWLQIAEPGGPTDDKPGIDCVVADPDRLTVALNIRVADIHAAVAEWTDRGAVFLTEPKDHGAEWRCYLRDPAQHLIEVGQANGRPDLLLP